MLARGPTSASSCVSETTPAVISASPCGCSSSVELVSKESASAEEALPPSPQAVKDIAKKAAAIIAKIFFMGFIPLSLYPK